MPLADAVAELRTLGLDALDSEDPTASLPAVLSWSLRHLTNQQRRVLALLSIAPGPDIALPAAANLSGLTELDTHAILRALVEASLIDRIPGGRYGMHDLVRGYATSIADDLPCEVRGTALRRVLDFYTHTAYAADRLVDPHRVPPAPSPVAGSTHPDRLADAAAAMAWFDTEHACLLAAQRTAATNHWYPTVWYLAWGLTTFHLWRGHRHDMLAVWRAAADAATHLPDPSALGRALRALGRTHAYLGHHDEAIENLHQALAIAQHHHDPAQQAHIHRALGRAWGQQGDDRRALDHIRHALDLYRGLDHPVSEARALTAVGWHAARLGEYNSARDHCWAALTLQRHHHNPDGEASALDNLGYVEYRSGRYIQSIDHYSHALTLRRKLGHSYYAAETLDRLGHPHVALGQTEPARAAWQEALQLYQEQGRGDDAARVQRLLDELGESGTGGTSSVG